MTETNKLRAVFLAALMFLAVFAGTVALAGSAAAGHGQTGEIDASQTNIVPSDRTINVTDEANEPQDIQLHVNVQNETTEYYEIDVSRSSDVGISVESATASADATGGSADASVDGDTVNVSVTALSSVTGDYDDNVTVSLSLNTSEATVSDDRVRHVVSDDYGNTANLDYRAIEQGTVVHVEGSGNVEAWEGETLTTYGDSVDQIVSVETLGSKGTTPGHARNWDTSGMDAGDYNITYASTEYENQLTVKPLNLSVAADNVHADENVTAQVSTEDLNGNEATVRLINSDDEVVATVTDNLDGDGNLEADLGQHAEGSYVVHVTHGPSSVTATTSVDVGQAPESVVNFDESVISQNQGDVAVVTLNATEEFELQVGDDNSVNYEATMVVTPNEDGQAVIAINTYEAGYWHDDQTEGDAYEGLEGTDVSVSSETQLEDGLEQGLYDMIARNPADSDDEYDIAALDVQDRSTDGVTAYTAPQGKWSATDSAASIRNGTETGIVTEADEIAMNDHVVLELEATGIFGALEDVDDYESYIEADNGVNLTLEQTNPGKNIGPKTINLSDSGSVVHVDEDNKTVWVALDGRDLNVDQDNREVKAGDNYNVTFEVGSSYEFADEAESVNDEFSMVERTGELNVDNDGYVTVQSDEGQEISGVTSVAPGTDLTIRARATGESPFLKSQSAEVHDHGDGPEFHAEFDFSNINVGQEFTVSTQRGGFSAEAPGRVAESDYASVSVSDQEAEETGDVVTVDSVYLPEGGFVTVHDDSLLDGATFDSVRGTSDYLSEGEHSNVEVELDEPYDLGDHEVIPMAHQDTNDNQEYDFVDSEGADDGPYEDQNGEAVTDSATLSVVEEDTETPTPTDTEEPSDDDSTEEPTDTATEEPDDQPGFGAVVALIALLGAALLAARRNAF